MPAGESGDRLLLTIFNRRTQPLIRYELSDMVRLLDGDCECGRPFRLMASIEGRTEDVLEFTDRDGRSEPVSIHPNAFHQLLETVPATGWQVRQEEDGLSVLLTGVPDPSVCEPLATSIRHALEAQGVTVPSIQVRAVDKLERGATGKAPLIVARRALRH